MVIVMALGDTSLRLCNHMIEEPLAMVEALDSDMNPGIWLLKLRRSTMTAVYSKKKKKF